jgi:UDP-3-O-[3-hydroxymyristoyl] glucosamine N-acyltransferase
MVSTGLPGVAVLTGVGVSVGVGDAVAVGVNVKVGEGVGDAVAVGSGVSVSVGSDTAVSVGSNVAGGPASLRRHATIPRSRSKLSRTNRYFTSASLQTINRRPLFLRLRSAVGGQPSFFA